MSSEGGALAFVVGCVAFLLFMMAGAIYSDHVHTEFLRTHGCQLLTEAPTGRQVYCGKACYRPEKVYVYECVDGTRTEVR
jgi:hypothetical protein